MMTVDREKDVAIQAYDRWAPVYDLVFGRVFRAGRRAAIEAAECIGGRVLEVGVSTGLSLPGYARGNSIFGVDISAEMLRKARDRVTRLRPRSRRESCCFGCGKIGFSRRVIRRRRRAIRGDGSSTPRKLLTSSRASC